MTKEDIKFERKLFKDALIDIAYWHRDKDEMPNPEGCRTCLIIASVGLPLDPKIRPDPFIVAKISEGKIND